jgi:hypothetical protein
MSQTTVIFILEAVRTWNLTSSYSLCEPEIDPICYACTTHCICQEPTIAVWHWMKTTQNVFSFLRLLQNSDHLQTNPVGSVSTFSSLCHPLTVMFPRNTAASLNTLLRITVWQLFKYCHFLSFPSPSSPLLHKLQSSPLCVCVWFQASGADKQCRHTRPREVCFWLKSTCQNKSCDWVKGKWRVILK